MTEEQFTDLEVEILNKYLGDEARKMSTGQIIKPTKNNLKEVSGGWEDLYEVGERVKESIKPYRYLLKEGNATEYIEKVGHILFGNIDISRPEANN
jgi:hypothetical protein